MLSSELYSANIPTKSIRQGVGDALLELGGQDLEIVVLTADLAESTKVDGFAKKFPHRFFEVGIAEQNMTGIAAGLASCGKTPFITSYACFSPANNWAQLRLSLAMDNSNVKVVGSHSGFSPSADGASHQAFEDIALTRVLPNFSVFVPADYLQAKKAALAAAKTSGPVYIRSARNDTPVFTTEETPFEPLVLKEGTQLTLVACGPVTYQALLAARELSMINRIEVEVIYYPILKPFDDSLLLRSVAKTKRVLTIEEHQIAGGLGGLVSEVLGEKLPSHIFRMGVNDEFGESGTYEELLTKYDLSSEAIVKKVLSLQNA